MDDSGSVSASPTARLASESTLPVAFTGVTPIQQDLHFVDDNFRERLQRYNLCGRVLHTESGVQGQGPLSDVFRGFCEVEENRVVKVAMKHLRLRKEVEVCKALFEKEIYIWAGLIHPNILPLLGYTFDERTHYPVLISEWMDNGDAFAYVRRNDPPIERILGIVYDVANGLEYLHHKERAVIHSDVKPENILISQTGVAMLCDFGCARTELASYPFAKPSDTLKGTGYYWAPELLRQEDGMFNSNTTKTDIWAFGTTIYALCTGTRPFSHRGPAASVAITRGELPIFPEAQSHREEGKLLQHISRACWNQTPAKRPSAGDIVNKLRRQHFCGLAESHDEIKDNLSITTHCSSMCEWEWETARESMDSNGDMASAAQREALPPTCDSTLDLFQSSDAHDASSAEWIQIESQERARVVVGALGCWSKINAVWKRWIDLIRL